MGPNIEVISYRFKTASAIMGFQQTLHHREWEYCSPSVHMGPVSSLPVRCHQLGLAGEGEGALLGLSWQRAFDAFCVQQGLGALGGRAGHPPWHLHSCPSPCPAPAPLAATLQQQIWAKMQEFFKIPRTLLWDSLIFHGQDHQYQNLGDGRQKVVDTQIYHSKSGFGLFSLIFREECAHRWNRFGFESCDLSGTLQPQLFRKRPQRCSCCVCLLAAGMCKAGDGASPVSPVCRLGGIPVGVVAVETRTVELSIPADPANLDSEAKVGGLCAPVLSVPLSRWDSLLSPGVVLMCSRSWGAGSAWIVCEHSCSRPVGIPRFPALLLPSGIRGGAGIRAQEM